MAFNLSLDRALTLSKDFWDEEYEAAAKFSAVMSSWGELAGVPVGGLTGGLGQAIGFIDVTRVVPKAVDCWNGLTPQALGSFLETAAKALKWVLGNLTQWDTTGLRLTGNVAAVFHNGAKAVQDLSFLANTGNQVGDGYDSGRDMAQALGVVKRTATVVMNSYGLATALAGVAIPAPVALATATLGLVAHTASFAIKHEVRALQP